MSTSRVRASLSRPRVEALEIVACCALALIAAFMHPPGERLPRLSPDSFQYLSAAQELRTSQRISTSLVHFDTERSHGVIPAPLTWFPPGYPAAIARLSSLGLGFEAAARHISVASHVLVAPGVAAGTEWLVLHLALGVAAVSVRSLSSYPPPTRYYVPVLPHAIALAACGVAFLIRRLPRGGCLRAVTAGVVACLVAGYLAGRPYTLLTRDEAAPRRELARFKAPDLLVFRDPEPDQVILGSRFLGALAEGHPPGWLRLAGMSRDVCVYRMGSGET